MILAAGRGERMRPLSDRTPKPLLEAGGKPLIVWQIEALARAGLSRIVINAAHLAGDLVDRLGDGRALGVSLAWSLEPEALETAGGIATALPLLPSGPAVIVSADVWSAFDYATLLPRAAAMAADAGAPRLHLVMVPNPGVPSVPAISRSPPDRRRCAGRLALDRRCAPHLRQHRSLRHRAVRRTSALDATRTAAAVSRLDRSRDRERRTLRWPLGQRGHSRRPRRARRCAAAPRSPHLKTRR